MSSAFHEKCARPRPQRLGRDGGRDRAHDLCPTRPRRRGRAVGQGRRHARRQFPAVERLLRDTAEELTAFAAFPRAHWRKLWSTNPLERLNREVKRRTNVVGIFPHDDAVLRLVCAVLVEQHDEWQVTDRRYLAEHSMAALTAMRDTNPAKEVTANSQLAS